MHIEQSTSRLVVMLHPRLFALRKTWLLVPTQSYPSRYGKVAAVPICIEIYVACSGELNKHLEAGSKEGDRHKN